MPANRYLVLKARRCMGPVLMDHMLLVAFDDWDTNEERFSTAWTPLKQSLGVTLGGTYDFDFYGPSAAATFLTPDFAFQYEFQIFLDTGHELELFDRCRLHARTPQEELDNEHLWITVRPDRSPIDSALTALRSVSSCWRAIVHHHRVPPMLPPAGTVRTAGPPC